MFRYKYGGVGFGCKGMPGGTSIAVYSNGDVVKCEYYFGDNEPIERIVLAKLPELAKSVAEIIARNADKLKTIPDFLNNGTLDAPGDFFAFGKKNITAWCIQRTNRDDVRSSYYEAYKDNIVYENAVLGHKTNEHGKRP